MTASNPAFYLWLRVPPENQDNGLPAASIEEETKEDMLEKEEYIRCRQCRNIIASPDDRIAIQGAHRHTFANPHGIVFEIGCFKGVKGCGHVGAPSDEFS